MEINFQLLEEDVEVECYICSIYYMDYEILRDIPPVHGVVKRENYRDIYFRPYGKNGRLLQKKISYYGRKFERLSGFDNLEECVAYYNNQKILIKEEIDNDIIVLQKMQRSL